MKQDKNITEVYFLMEKEEGDLPCNVFAFFPSDKYNEDAGPFTCYAHIGQHSSCHRDYAKECREASREEYKDLKKELEGLGYNLKVLNTRATTLPQDNEREQSDNLEDDIYGRYPTPNSGEAKQPNYKGKGEHSVNELEAICQQFKEYIHLMNSGQINGHSGEAAAPELFTGGEWGIGKFYTSRNKEFLPIVSKREGVVSTIAVIQPIRNKITEEDKANAALIARLPALLKENEELKLLSSVRLAVIKEANNQNKELREALKLITGVLENWDKASGEGEYTNLTEHAKAIINRVQK